MAVTGGGRGIGEGIVHRFAQEGAFVYILEIDRQTGQAVEQEVRKKGYTGKFLQCDVGDEMSVQSAFQHIQKEHSALHVLINNAGTGLIRKVEEITVHEWDHLMHVNLRGMFLCVREGLPLMRKTSASSIVNIGSVHGDRSISYNVCYAASKGGVAAMTRAMASELGQEGIRVNAVQPGVIVTLAAQEMRKKMPVLERRGRVYEQNQAVAHKGTPEDIASICLFLVSEEARFITGQVITSDGGLTIGLPKTPE